ncbi:MAG TPA: glycosyltransferase family 39 protein [Candidatus Acidoferrales bacterium]|nr:glycosyltransferase family 39 protein [Candidatus Acidoferrales bacterium]
MIGYSKPGSRPLAAAAALLIVSAFLLALAVSAGISLASAGRLLGYDGETTNSDTSIGYFGYRVYRGQPAYTRADQPPYTPCSYGPLAYLALGAVGRLASPATFQSFLRDGRTFIFLLFLLIAVLAYRWARSCGVGRLLAFSGPLFVLGDPTFFPYAAGQRPDIAALLLALLAFYLLSTAEEPGDGRMVAAGLSIGLALLFKQSFLAAPASAFVWLTWNRRYRSAAVLTAAALAPVIVTIGWLEWRGEPVLYSLFLYHITLYDPRGEARLIGLLALACPTVLLQVVAGLAGLAALRRRFPAVGRLAALYLALAAAIDLLTMAQVGAARYYLVETLTICSFLAPLGLERILEHLRVSPIEQRLGVALALVAPPAICAMGLAGALTLPLPHWSELTALTSGRPVLSDLPYVAAQAKDPELIDTHLMSIMEVTGAWSPAPVLRQIAAQHFDYIVLRTEPGPGGRVVYWQPYRNLANFSPTIFRQVQTDYRLAGPCVDRQAAVFVPRQEPRGTQLARRLAPACGWRTEVPPGPGKSKPAP